MFINQIGVKWYEKMDCIYISYLSLMWYSFFGPVVPRHGSTEGDGPTPTESNISNT
jgi:hypothetical protein